MEIKKLNTLSLSEQGYIKSIDMTADIKRRLLDMGFTIGELVTPLYKSPLGDPTAYSIMGSVVALRSDIASKIMVLPKEVLEVQTY